ncbi:hypothetical protein [cyanobacterium endosymbiont of Rhopalodia gibberula]|nr:hypothetical protein [cyanobacterium endosymbiont of Rhopalodia gibberula]
MRLLVLFRLDEIACRTVGHYKCLAYRLTRNLPSAPNHNHIQL